MAVGHLMVMIWARAHSCNTMNLWLWHSLNSAMALISGLHICMVVLMAWAGVSGVLNRDYYYTELKYLQKLKPFFQRVSNK